MNNHGPVINAQPKQFVDPEDLISGPFALVVTQLDGSTKQHDLHDYSLIRLTLAQYRLKHAYVQIGGHLVEIQIVAEHEKEGRTHLNSSYILSFDNEPVDWLNYNQALIEFVRLVMVAAVQQPDPAEPKLNPTIVQDGSQSILVYTDQDDIKHLVHKLASREEIIQIDFPQIGIYAMPCPVDNDNDHLTIIRTGDDIAWNRLTYKYQDVKQITRSSHPGIGDYWTLVFNR